MRMIFIIPVEPPRKVHKAMPAEGKGRRTCQAFRGLVGRVVGRARQEDIALVDMLRQREQDMPLDPMFHSGDAVVITDGPVAGIEAICQMANANRRAFILLETLSKPVSMQIDVGRLRKAG